MKLLFPLLVLCLTRVEGASQKKGLAVPSKNFRCGDFQALHGVAWWYDWGQRANYHNACGGQVMANHVPMIWGSQSSSEGRGDIPMNIPADAQAVLGFNEPNFHAQANLSPENAASRWHKLQQKAGNKVLVSPSAAPCGDTNICNADAAAWFQRFFDACSGCRVDFLATHGNWCDANIMMNYLEGLWNQFHKKIWVTELSCPQMNSVVDQLNYMKAVLPRLEAADYVDRYAWFATRFHGDGWVPREASLLQQDSSTLTELGTYYINF